MKVIVRDNDVGKACRLLKRKLHNEGVLKEVHNRRAFVSVGEKKRTSLEKTKTIDEQNLNHLCKNVKNLLSY